MASGILTIVEQNDGKVSRIGWEALAAAQEIGAGLNQPANALVLGKNAQAAAQSLAEVKIQQAWFAENAELANYTPDGFSAAARQVIEKTQPAYVLAGHSYQARDYMPKLATRFDRVFVSDCVGFRLEGGAVVFVRQMFQGKINADFSFNAASGNSYFVSFQAGAISSDKVAKGGHAAVADAGVNLSGVAIRTKVLEIFEGVKGKVDLTKTDIIVAVGRGIKEKDKLPVVEELAKALGAELAASRPVCDDGWLPMDRQIGSSGQTVAPKLYVAVGISGAIQHIVGMKSSRVVVAINKDERAPIFDLADYGVVGDLFEVVPALTAAIKEVKGDDTMRGNPLSSPKTSSQANDGQHNILSGKSATNDILVVGPTRTDKVSQQDKESTLSIRELLSGQIEGDFESLASIDFVIFGDYSKGVSKDKISELRETASVCESFQKMITEYTQLCYPKLPGEYDDDYADRISEWVGEMKMKVALICLAPLSDVKGINELKYSYRFDVFDAYDPNDKRLIRLNREDVFAMSSYKFYGDFLLNIDAGIQIPRKELQKLFLLLYKHQYDKEFLSFKGNGYWVTRGSH